LKAGRRSLFFAEEGGRRAKFKQSGPAGVSDA
jgi:hypothetical protein